MIELYYTIVEDVDFDISSLNLSEYRLNKISETASPLKVKQGICAELLLNYAAKKHFSDIELPLDIFIKNNKPAISGELKFSLSHSEKIAACAVSNREIGMDVQIEKKYNPKLPEKIFSDKELAEYRSTGCTLDSFYRLWTMKESYIKALGIGLNREIKKYSVINSPTSDKPAPYFWHDIKGEYHFSICSLEMESTPDKFEFVPLQKLLF